VFFSFLLNIRLGQWQIRDKAKLYGLFQVVSSIVTFLFSLVFVVTLHFGPEGRIYGILLASILVGLASYLSLINDRLLLFKYNKQDIMEALSFGLPLIPHVLGGVLLLSIDRLVINKELGLEMTGIYMVAVSLGGAVNILLNSINKAYTPWLYRQLKENNKKIKIEVVKKTYMYFIFLISMSLLSYFIGPPVLKLIVGERFHQAANVLPYILIGQFLLGMYFVVSNYIFYVKKTKYLSFVTISSGLINVVLLLILIPYYGINGAAYAFIIANLWQFVSTWIVSSKLYPMPWTLRGEL